MAISHQKLAAALEELRLLQAEGARVFTTAQLSRLARERLIKHGFLQEAMKGWLISSSPAAQPGDTTPWFASLWEFCRRYCEERFGDAWHLSPEQSLLLHGEDTAIPKQVIIYSPAANNNRVDLLFDTSLFLLKQKQMPPARDLEVRSGLRVFRVEAALLRVPAGFFSDHPVEAHVVVSGLRDPSELLSRLLEGGHAVIAGRLAGAFRHLGRPAIADEIVSVMKAADHDVREADPFERERAPAPAPRPAPAIARRLQTLWASSRDIVLAELPRARGLPTDHDACLARIDGIYKLDAYHSLSIEGYQVTPQLVERVSSGDWEPERDASDRDASNALAAHGYWLAFQRVRDAVRRILTSSGDIAALRSAHREWYRELFAPHVAAGLRNASMLAGYRRAPVFLRGSRHIPPRAELLGEAMQALFDLIESEPAPAVRAVLSHWLVGYVHPFPDGNGRVARFLMNALLASGGYPWTVIRVDGRTEYLAALEAASVGSDIRPFARFVAAQMRRSAPRAARVRGAKPARRPVSSGARRRA